MTGRRPVPSGRTAILSAGRAWCGSACPAIGMRGSLVRAARRAVLGLVLCLAACIAEPAVAPSPSDWTQPANLGKDALQAVAYHDSGAYLHDLTEVDSQAGDWLAVRAPHVSRPALVLDIDETSLSNWVEIKANGFGHFNGGTCDALPRGPCGFDAWAQLEQASALPPTLALYRRARQLGIAVFFITGRHADMTNATAANLRQVGYRDWDGLFLEPQGSHFASAADFKAPTRAAIESRGYTILASVGDQRSDLDGGHAERGYLLPNPFYFLP